jgi:Fe-S-cluster containining protein
VNEKGRTAKLSLRIGDATMDIEVEVPEGLTRPASLVPLAHAIAEAASDVASDRSRSEGRPISCRKGCGACCRQLVPVAEVEARRLADVVAEMPEPRRRAVRARFDEVRRRLDEAGLLERVRAAGTLRTKEERRDLHRDYFRLGLACPFLEDESCSIHTVRPAICREYLVTTPAAACAQPSPETIRRVEVSTRVSRALFDLGRPAGIPGAMWLPLSIVLDWVGENPEPPPEKTGEELIRQLVEGLRGGAQAAGDATQPDAPER